MKGIKIGKHVIPLWLIAVILISGIGGSLGYYVWKTLTVQVEVKEPIEVLQYPSSLSLYPGETREFNVTVGNHALINYSVVLDFQLGNTTYQDAYTTFSNEIYAVVSGQQNLTAWIQVRADAPAMNTTLSISFARGIYPSGLVGYWRFDEGNGAIASDSSGNNNNGTLNGPKWVNGKYGKALNFDGVDDWVGVPTLFSTSPSALTVSAWINSPLSKMGYVFYHGDNGELSLQNGDLYVNGSVKDPEVAGFGIKLSDGSGIFVLSNSMKPNVWHNIVGVWVKGVALRIYVDGVLAGESTTIPDLYPYDPGSGYQPTIGTYNSGFTGQPDRFFNGTIDNLMVYNRALSPQEVIAEYTGSMP